MATILGSSSARLISSCGEHLGVAGRGGGSLGLLAGDHVELDHGVVLVVGGLGVDVALALLGDGVDQHRLVVHRLDVLQHGDQVAEIMTVDRTDVVEAQLLEEGAAGRHAAGVFLGLAGGVLQLARQDGAGDRLAELAQRPIGAAGHQLGQIGAHPAHRRGDGHLVVVQDDDQPVGGLGGLVHRLIGHAGAHRPVADHGDDAVAAALAVAAGAEAQGGRDGGGGVGRAEGVVFALGALGETRQAPALAQGADAVAPAGEDLVRIGLVADVPDDDVVRRVEHVVQGDRQLDHAQARAQVPAGVGDRVDGLQPQLVGQLLQLCEVQALHVRGRVDGVEQRGVWHGARLKPEELSSAV